MSIALATLRPSVRFALGDLAENGVYAYKDAQIDDALTALFTMGLSPRCLTLVGATIDPDPPSNATTGYLCIKAALLLLGGSFAGSYRTRPLSVHRPAAAKRDQMTDLRLLLHELEDSGLVCSATPLESSQYIHHDWLTRLADASAEL